MRGMLTAVRSHGEKGSPVEYAAPTTVDEARTLLADNPGSRVFAGATDVVPQMRSGRPEPSVLIDLKRIDRLMSVSYTHLTLPTTHYV